MNEEVTAARLALLEILFEHCEKERRAYRDVLEATETSAAFEVLERFDRGEVAAWRNKIRTML